MSWVEAFEWESEEQRRGYLALVTWARDRGLSVEVTPSDLFFIQKDHESNEWWSTTVGNQINGLLSQIHFANRQIRALRDRLEQLELELIELRGA